MNTNERREIEAPNCSYAIADGLSTQQAERFRSLYGRNDITPPPRESRWKALLKQFSDPTIKILLCAAALSLIVASIETFALDADASGFVDTIGVFAAIALATLVAYASEQKSAREFDALNKLREEILVSVYRDGQIQRLPIGDLVVGDVVELSAGDKVPVDGVVLETSNLFADESPFTGESIPARKRATREPWNLAALRANGKLGDESFVARGSTISDGRALLLAIRVGDATEMGRIAEALATSALDDSETPLAQKLSRLANKLGAIGVCASALIFAVMCVAATASSPLAPALARSPLAIAATLMLSLVFGYFLERNLARPFFAAVGSPLNTKTREALAVLPSAVACATLLVGAWGIMSGETASGIALLKATLLAFVVAVTVVVVAVPEGLPMMTTVSLALNTRKMARQNCLVRRLIASETIGSATVICTDKTGTLTQNKMSPALVFANGREFAAAQFDELRRSSAWAAIARGIAVNSRANLRAEPSERASGKTRFVGVGNPTECALLLFLAESKVDYRAERFDARADFFDLEHNSDRKFSAVAYETTDGTNRCLLKGAPEKILAFCDSILVDGKREPLAEYLETARKSLKQASERALRVLAFCEKSLDSNEREALEKGNEEEQMRVLTRANGVLVAMIGLADPPRPEARESVEICQQAGIQVKMITGDSLATAKAIAKSVGILRDGEDQLAMTSDEFAAVGDAELPDAAEKLAVLARSTPRDKLRVVQALHRMGEVVAMTGDGTNDAPALTAADVGLSMGVSGTEVAKEASDVVLMDDNFKSVATGVWWGRALFQNIRRFLQFQLSVNCVALICSTLGPIVGVPLPLTVAQLLWINIIMDTFAAIAFSSDPPRRNVLKRKPIPRAAEIISPSMGVSIAVASVYQATMLFLALFNGWFVLGEPYSPLGDRAANLEALTIFFTMLVMFEFWHKFNCRSLRFDESPFALLTKNKTFLAVVLSITALQIVMVQIPLLGELFRTTPLKLSQWIKIILFTSTILPVGFVGRWLAHKLGLDDKERLAN